MRSEPVGSSLKRMEAELDQPEFALHLCIDIPIGAEEEMVVTTCTDNHPPTHTSKVLSRNNPKFSQDTLVWVDAIIALQAPDSQINHGQ